MNWNEYAEAAGKFDLTKNREQSVQFVHAYLGFSSEIEELNNAMETHNHPNIKEELGDMCWYIAILSRLTKHEPDVSVQGGVSQSEAANIAKRWFVGGKTPSEAAINGVTNSMFKHVVFATAQRYGIPMEDIYKANIAKLTLRTAGNKSYAETLEEADRDRAAEAKIMEGK